MYRLFVLSDGPSVLLRGFSETQGQVFYRLVDATPFRTSAYNYGVSEFLGFVFRKRYLATDWMAGS